jgi:hypothetical protein
MANIKTATISCEILNDNKEEPGSFHVQLFHEGELLFERKHWGLRENWDNGSSHETTSGNLDSRQLLAHAGYVLRVYIDEGEHLDVNANWSVAILTTDHTELVSAPYPYIFEKSVRECEVSFVL